MASVRRCAVILAATGGVFLSSVTPLRLIASAIVVTTTITLWITRAKPSLTLSAAAFVIVFAVRYAFLFLSFTQHGIAPWLRARLGEARGFAVYEAATAIAFFLRGLTFAWLVDATALPSTVLPVGAKPFFVAVGTVIALGGTIINVWSTLVVGLETYFYRDLFTGRLPEQGFKAEGPYRIFRNPMYGIGQSAAYGLAIAAMSPIGIVATLANQIAMYVFNARFEQPHLARALAQRRCEG